MSPFPWWLDLTVFLFVLGAPALGAILFVVILALAAATTDKGDEGGHGRNCGCWL